MTSTSHELTALDTVTSALPGGGEHRAGQQQMAEIVAEVTEKGGHAVIQAGTGTGKSLAYLVPAVLSGKRTIIATATKALQDQLIGKDLPFLAAHLGTGIDYAVLKGRSNYLCRQRLDEASDSGQSRLDGISDRLGPGRIAALQSFADRTDTGDRDDSAMRIDDRTWRLVSVTSEECPGAPRCPQGQDCFAERARHRAAQARLVVVNLHLYSIDVLAGGQVLGDHDLVVIDEAHQFEEIFSSVAGCSVTPGRFTALARRVPGVMDEPELTGALTRIAERLRLHLTQLVGHRLDAGPDRELEHVLDTSSDHIGRLLTGLRCVADTVGNPVLAARALRAQGAAASLLTDINALRVPGDDEILWVDAMVTGGEVHNPALRATPVEIDASLADELWSKRAAVLTSATIPLNLTDRLGLPPTAVESDVGSPFDYEANALLYCPHLPSPRQGDRRLHWEELTELIEAAGGRTLALFTSYRAMQEAADHCASRLTEPVLVQDAGSKAALIGEFAAHEETSLFATMSFWQGVDVPGPSCSLVVIDRLPFPRPDDPVLQARRERAERSGHCAFGLIDLPRAATLLAQGAGRLIRSTHDRGVVAVLDSRLATAGYRWKLLEALPPMRRTRDRRETIDFLRSLRR